MSELEKSVLDDLAERVQEYSKRQEGYVVSKFIASGGSAAVFEVATPDGPRVLKVSDPKFLLGERGEAERRRLSLQKRLIGHKCDSLVKLYRVEECDGSAFVEMEYISWPRLKDVLDKVPDTSVGPLIQQLVRAVRYLETQEVVHRDIKPENIHVSEDFQRLMLLDLGVARELKLETEEALFATDHGGQRPFVATAQYSSPEYLFRLDAPSPALWKALSLYQVGAVLHDMIRKLPLFDSEVNLGNRWLLTRAVLTKIPSFAEVDPKRLLALKALSARCLVKDSQTRLRIVDWDDFDLESKDDSLEELRRRLSKGPATVGAQAMSAERGRLEFERNTYGKKLSDAIRYALIPVCDTKLPMSVRPTQGHSHYRIRVELQLPDNSLIALFGIELKWREELEARMSDVTIAAKIVSKDAIVEDCSSAAKILCVTGIDDDETVAAHSISDTIAKAILHSLSLVETSADKSTLIGKSILP